MSPLTFTAPLSPYRVERGDTIESIAEQFGLTAEEIAEVNNLALDTELGIGTVIVVPSEEVGDVLVPAVLVANPDRVNLIEVFQRWSAQYGAPPELLMALAWSRSQWDSTVTGPNGEVGVGQLTSELATWIADNVVGIPLDPEIQSENIQLSAAYLGWLLDQTEDDTSASLAAFYDGLTSQRNIPWRQDTVEFISDVLSLRPVFDPRAAVSLEG